MMSSAIKEGIGMLTCLCCMCCVRRAGWQLERAGGTINVCTRQNKEA